MKKKYTEVSWFWIILFSFLSFVTPLFASASISVSRGDSKTCYQYGVDTIPVTVTWTGGTAGQVQVHLDNANDFSNQMRFIFNGSFTSPDTENLGTYTDFYVSGGGISNITVYGKLYNRIH